MNKNIFIALFVISAILNVILLVTKEKNTIKSLQKTESYSEESISANEKEVLIDSIRKLTIERSELKYFNLEDNNYALKYFTKMGIKNPTKLIISTLLKTNTNKKRHTLIRFESKNGSFQINKIKILNNKWIICDFSDGEIWGELLLKYHINDDKKVEFTVIDDLIYPEVSE
ncbi:hydrolase [Capnocytophaga felis]|uniref:Hydrolase n=1 Tax=Capnocytophaga felis TaxID=2267611 RepID=A0A5M4B6H3_9FLAO|nr:hydrolase [Capnocytophaga felis]GET44865.1 hypothetical protein RCZ01_01670 [Capnocytophaga felis]GET48608.1 hypothetical protein RCZ02_14390 [Capnocytophaga felis]